MSILNKTPIQKTEAEYKAEQIINSTVNLTEIIVMEWMNGIDTLWDAENTQSILDVIGTDSAEVFELSDAIISLMGQILPEKLPERWLEVQEKLSKIKPHTINEDGTVTIENA